MNSQQNSNQNNKQGNNNPDSRNPAATATENPEQTREIICIACPVGCHLQVMFRGGLAKDASPDPDTIAITGNRCPRGEIYGREEVLAPTRMVTTTIPVAGSSFARRVPVRTTGPIPVARIPDLLTQLHAMELHAPLARGQVLLTVEGSENSDNEAIQVVTSHRA